MGGSVPLCLKCQCQYVEGDAARIRDDGVCDVRRGFRKDRQYEIVCRLGAQRLQADAGGYGIGCRRTLGVDYGERVLDERPLCIREAWDALCIEPLRVVDDE
ncbi:MAG: hypothetical protein JO101_07970 [Candidatus Eremiobacteraeota bacterium]|nr:hypothetical protein [Candidatus Eremiobacteraeota bacterium]